MTNYPQSKEIATSWGDWTLWSMHAPLKDGGNYLSHLIVTTLEWTASFCQLLRYFEIIPEIQI